MIRSSSPLLAAAAFALLALPLGCSRSPVAHGTSIQPRQARSQQAPAPPRAVRTPEFREIAEAVARRDFARALAGIDLLGPAARSSASVRIVEARARMAAGQLDAALLGLDGIEASLPALADYVLYWRGVLQQLGGAHREASETFETLLHLYPRSRFAPLARAGAADARLDLGDAAGALQRYRAIAAEKAPGIDPVARRHRLARALSATGATAEAETIEREIVVSFPAHPLGFSADPRSLTFGERLKRSEALDRVLRWQQAAEELSGAEADAPTRPLLARALYVRGMALYHDRAHYLDAARDLARAGELFAPGAAETVEAGFHAARALSRADRDPEAAAAYRAFARRHPGTSRADEALYRAAYLEFNASDFRTARASFEKVLAAGLREPWKKSAVFCAAFASLRLGDPAGAIRWLTQGYPLESADPLVGARGRYWLGVANLESGRRTEAAAAWRQILRRFPLDYYALLARQRLESIGENPGPALSGAPPPARRVDVPEPPEPIATLLRIGLVEDAAQEIERRETEIRRDGIERLVAYYERAHAVRRTYHLALVNLSALADRPPGGRARRAWELLYPRPYEPELSTLERENGLPPNFLYAIMRQESAFDPDEVSSAEAIGLLQMIPPTTRRVAAAMGIEYHDDVLFDVHVNLATGARYIGALHRKFGGQLPLVIGSFNAGPRAMARFVDRFGDRPTDEFVELITYDQTRTYVRRVLSALARYRFLYGRDAAAPQAWPLAIDMHIDRRYAPDPDY